MESGREVPVTVFVVRAEAIDQSYPVKLRGCLVTDQPPGSIALPVLICNSSPIVTVNNVLTIHVNLIYYCLSRREL